MTNYRTKHDVDLGEIGKKLALLAGATVLAGACQKKPDIYKPGTPTPQPTSTPDLGYNPNNDCVVYVWNDDTQLTDWQNKLPVRGLELKADSSGQDILQELQRLDKDIGDFYFGNDPVFSFKKTYNHALENPDDKNLARETLRFTRTGVAGENCEISDIVEQFGLEKGTMDMKSSTVAHQPYTQATLYDNNSNIFDNPGVLGLFVVGGVVLSYLFYTNAKRQAIRARQGVQQVTSNVKQKGQEVKQKFKDINPLNKN